MPQSKSPAGLLLSMLVGAGLIGGVFYYKKTQESTAPHQPTSESHAKNSEVENTHSKKPENPAPESKPIHSDPVSIRPQTIETQPKPTESKPAQTKPAPVAGAFDIKQLPTPPHNDEKQFIDFMVKARNEDPKYLDLRYQRAMSMIANKDLYREKEINAFLMTARESFVRDRNLSRVYDHAFLDIGYGVTISGPFLVGRMTSVIDVQPGEKVLEVGTGSGYQSAVLAHLTDQVYTVEIIEPLAKETNEIYSSLSKDQYPEYKNISRKADDGYFGWAEKGPFDKIIVTCGIDHIPPELLKQLKVGGIMVIPVGPPGAQVVLKVTKTVNEQGEVAINREDIYQGRKKVPFVPFTKKGGGTWNQ